MFVLYSTVCLLVHFRAILFAAHPMYYTCSNENSVARAMVCVIVLSIIFVVHVIKRYVL